MSEDSPETTTSRSGRCDVEVRADQGDREECPVVAAQRLRQAEVGQRGRGRAPVRHAHVHRHEGIGRGPEIEGYGCTPLRGIVSVIHGCWTCGTSRRTVTTMASPVVFRTVTLSRLGAGALVDEPPSHGREWWKSMSRTRSPVRCRLRFHPRRRSKGRRGFAARSC